MTGPLDVPVTVQLDLHGPHAVSIRCFVERDLGWHVVDDPGAAAVTLTDGHGTAGGAPAAAGEAGVRLPAASALAAQGRPPVVLLVTADQPPAVSAVAAVRTRTQLVVAWPDQRAQLPVEVARLARSVRPASAAVDLTIGGSAGGVGTTTVTLAIGGWLAWSRRRVLVLACGAVPAPAAGPVAPDDLIGAATWGAAAPAVGLVDLRVVGTTAPAARAPIDAGAAEVVLRDVGVSSEADVLVVRGDAAGLHAVATTTAGAVVVVGGGLVRTPRMRAAAGGRHVIEVAWSARVARAALAGRVPAGLPGRWLRALQPLATSVLHSPSGRDAATGAVGP